MDLTGDWTVQATVPGGGEYTGRISARHAGDAVTLEWDITAGRYVGIGLPLGDHWYVACGDTWEGLGLALIAADGTARWTTQAPEGTVQTGHLTAHGSATWAADDTFPFASVAVAGDGDVLSATLTLYQFGNASFLKFHVWFSNLSTGTVI